MIKIGNDILHTQIPKGIYGRIYVRFKVRFKEHRDASKEIVPKNLREIYNKISAGFRSAMPLRS